MCGCDRVAPYEMRLVSGGPSGYLSGFWLRVIPGRAHVCRKFVMCGDLGKVAPYGMWLVCGGPSGCLPGFWVCVLPGCVRLRANSVSVAGVIGLLHILCGQVRARWPPGCLSGFSVCVVDVVVAGVVPVLRVTLLVV